MNQIKELPIIMTMVAGRKHLLFGALRGYKEVVAPLQVDTPIFDIKQCLDAIVQGFAAVLGDCPTLPAAISFAFPGPADYNKGIIGRLNNIPCFDKPVPLGPILEERFGIPVFINNDASLFSYGEYSCGRLKDFTNMAKRFEIEPRFSNLLGITLGTGLGCGIIANGSPMFGDNYQAGAIWRMKRDSRNISNAEDLISERGLKKIFTELANIPAEGSPQSEEIAAIALGKSPGDCSVAVQSFKVFGNRLGDLIADLVSVIDGTVILGGGLIKFYPLFSNDMFASLTDTVVNSESESSGQSTSRILNLEDPNHLKRFLEGNTREIQIPDTRKSVEFIDQPYIGVAITHLGTDRAISIGSYHYAMMRLIKEQTMVIDFPFEDLLENLIESSKS